MLHLLLCQMQPCQPLLKHSGHQELHVLTLAICCMGPFSMACMSASTSSASSSPGADRAETSCSSSSSPPDSCSEPFSQVKPEV